METDFQEIGWGSRRAPIVAIWHRQSVMSLVAVKEEKWTELWMYFHVFPLDSELLHQLKFKKGSWDCQVFRLSRICKPASVQIWTVKDKFPMIFAGCSSASSHLTEMKHCGRKTIESRKETTGTAATLPDVPCMVYYGICIFIHIRLRWMVHVYINHLTYMEQFGNESFEKKKTPKPYMAPWETNVRWRRWMMRCTSWRWSLES